MIEKELYITSEDASKISVFYIKADTALEFFSTGDKLAKELNKRTGNKHKFRIDYEGLFNIKKIDTNTQVPNYAHTS